MPRPAKHACKAKGMIITNHFVLINFPKTGTTFARQVISELYGEISGRQRLSDRLLALFGGGAAPFFKVLFLPKTEFRNGYNRDVDQHGRYEQVPVRYRSLPVLGIMREPVERNISFYEYGWWKTHTVAPMEEIKRVFPTFPDLDFASYLDYQNFNTGYRDTGVAVGDDVGNQTVQFIQFFFRDPRDAFSKLCDDYIYTGAYQRDMPDLTLLRTSALNEGLHDYLLKCGLSRESLEFVLKKHPVRPENTERSSEQDRRLYLADGMVEEIRYKERYLLKICADHGIEF